MGLISALMLKILSQNAPYINRKLIIRAAVIAVLFSLIAAEIFLLVKEKYKYGFILAGAPLAVILILFLLQNMAYAPIVILFTGAFIPLSLPTGRGSPIVASLAISMFAAGFWLLKMVSVDKQFAIKPSPVNKPVLGFIIATVISLIWSNLFRDPMLFVPSTFIFVQLGAGAVMIVSPVVMLMVGNFIHQERLLKIMVGIMLVIGVFGLVENFSHVDLFSNTGGLTSMWVIALCAGMFLYIERLPKVYKVIYLVLAGLWVFWNFILNLSWIAGWLPGLVALGVIAFLRSKRIVLFLVILLVSYYFLNHAFIQQDLSSESTTSGDTRLAAWQANWTVTKDHLLFGTGPAGYAVYYMTLFPTNAMATHNNYIDVISETGIVGTIFYLWLFGTMAVLGYRLVRRLRGRKDFMEALAVSAFAGVIACIVIMAFGDWLLPFAYTQTIAGYNYTVYSWLFMGTLLAIDQMTRHEVASEINPIQ